MKRLISMILIVSLTSAFAACSAQKNDIIIETQSNTQTTESKNMNTIKIIIGKSELTATLYDNETAKEFKKRLPLTLDMSELHGNEKYYYFDKALPADASVPSEIHTGDIKLYGNDCLVIFYDNFSTSYSYTDIGKIDDSSGFAKALGNGDITITFTEANK